MLNAGVLLRQALLAFLLKRMGWFFLQFGGIKGLGDIVAHTTLKQRSLSPTKAWAVMPMIGMAGRMLTNQLGGFKTKLKNPNVMVVNLYRYFSFISSCHNVLLI